MGNCVRIPRNLNREDHNLPESTTTKLVDQTATASSQSSPKSIDKEAVVNWQPSENHPELPDARLERKRRFHDVKESPYVLPADLCEQERLILQHMLVTYGFGKLFNMPIEDALIKGNSVILDCGCGPGSWTREVAKKYPNATVIGVDMAKTVLDNTDLYPNLNFQYGNVLEKLPFDDNTFDGVYQRLLIFGIPKDKWVDVIKELKRVTKPGGYIELVEYRGEIFRMGPNLTKLLKPSLDGLAARGFDIDAGLNIADYMTQAGVELVKEEMHSAPIGWGGKFGELVLVNTLAAWSGMKPFLTKALSMSDEEYDKMVESAQNDCVEFKSYYNCYATVGRVPLSK